MNSDGQGSLLRAEKDGIVTLTLHRPEVRNALDLGIIRELRAAFDAIAAEATARCIILAGSGQAFCAGGDIQTMLERRGQALAVSDRLRGDFADCLERMGSLDAPILARIHGDCVGAGLGLALACDLSIASEQARFGAPFVGLGLVPDTALTYELPRRMGLQRAKELVLTGALLGARDAQAAGLVNRVVPAEQLDAEVLSLAMRLAQLPTRAVGQAKRALFAGSQGTRRDALEREGWLQGVQFTTPEHAEGVQAFLEKRKPDFRAAEQR